MQPRLSVLVLISGRGSNMQAIARACSSDRVDAHICAVISNQADAAGLTFARSADIPSAVISHRDFPDQQSFEAQLASKIQSFEPDLIVMAGFMKILSADFVEQFTGQLVNIHPS